MKNIQSTAKLIKSLCDKEGISINKMLIDSDAGARTYYNMLAGSCPSTDKMGKIAEYFDVSVDYLLGRTDNPEVNTAPVSSAKLKDDTYPNPEQIISNRTTRGKVAALGGGDTYPTPTDTTGAELKELTKERNKKK